MSNSIRQIIGPTKKQLLDLLQEWSQLQQMKLDPSLSHDGKLNFVKQHIFLLEGLKSRIQRASDLLQSKNDEWSKIIQLSKGEKRSEETEFYEKFNQPTDGSEGFIADMLNAQDQLLVIENCLRELQHAKSTMELPETSVRGQSPTPATSPAALSSAGQSFLPASAPPRDITPSGRLPSVMIPVSKLPKLQLPEFYGEETEFSAFWDVFETTIHNRADITPGDKFRYLVGLLKGKAAHCVAGIKVTSENYPHAVASLRERYGSSRTIKQYLYYQLEQLPKCISTETWELQETLDGTEKILHQLDALQEDLNQTLLISHVKAKFPYKIRFEIERLRGLETDWTMSELRSMLKRVISVYKRASNSENVEVENRNCSVDSINCHENNVDSVSNVQLGAPRIYPCVFCGNLHFNTDCQNFRSEQERLGVLYANMLCTYCFKPGHFKQNCLKFGQRQCFYCKQTNHNSALCRFVFGNLNLQAQNSNHHHNSITNTMQEPQHSNTHTFETDSGPIQTQNVEEFMSEGHHNAVQSAPIASTCNESNEAHWSTVQVPDSRNMLCSRTKEKREIKMMLTALATIKNPEQPDLCQRVRVILDSGCDQTFLLESVQEKLRLNAGPSEENTLSHFASSITGPMQIMARPAQVEMILQNGTHYKMDVQIISSIGAHQFRPSLHPEDLEILKLYDQHLADRFPNKKEIFNADNGKTCAS